MSAPTTGQMPCLLAACEAGGLARIGRGTWSTVAGLGGEPRLLLPQFKHSTVVKLYDAGYLAARLDEPGELSRVYPTDAARVFYDTWKASQERAAARRAARAGGGK